MNEPLGEREVLCVSQFTLYGDAAQGQPPELRRRRAGRSGPSRSTSRFCERARRRARRLRRAHGGRARQRRSGHPAPRVGAPRPRLAAHDAHDRFVPPLRRRAAPGGRCPTAAGPTACASSSCAAPADRRRGEDLGEPGTSSGTPTARGTGAPTSRPPRARPTGCELFGVVSFRPAARTTRSRTTSRATADVHRRDRRRTTRTGSSTSATRSSAGGAARRARPRR